MPVLRILHNNRCSKSRQTLQLLKDNGVEPEVIEYLKQPLDAQQLTDIKQQLGVDSYLEMMRKKEAEFTELGLNKDNVDEDELLQALVTTPKLLERPIVFDGKQARIGRPPENVLDLI